MSLIVAARFESFNEAERAASALMEHGVVTDDLHTFYVNPPGAHDRFPIGGDRAADPNTKGGSLTAVAGAAVIGLLGALIGGVVAYYFADTLLPVVAGAGGGAYIGALIGAVYSLGRDRDRTPQESARDHKNEGRASGVLLAVRTTEEHAGTIASVLKQTGGVEIERAQGQWRAGQWEDFDPLVSPNPQAPV